MLDLQVSVGWWRNNDTNLCHQNDYIHLWILALKNLFSEGYTYNQMFLSLAELILQNSEQYYFFKTYTLQLHVWICQAFEL